MSGAITTGAIAFSIGLTLRLKAMSQWIIWEVAGLFENIGVIQDSIETVARDRHRDRCARCQAACRQQGRNRL